jgi:hypothetical protein
MLSYKNLQESSHRFDDCQTSPDFKINKAAAHQADSLVLPTEFAEENSI